MKKLLSKVYKGHIVDVAVLELFIFKTKAGTINFICKYLIGASVILIGLDGFTGAATGGVNSHTFCYTAKDNTLGDIC